MRGRIYLTLITGLAVAFTADSQKNKSISFPNDDIDSYPDDKDMYHEETMERSFVQNKAGVNKNYRAGLLKQDIITNIFKISTGTFRKNQFENVSKEDLLPPYCGQTQNLDSRIVGGNTTELGEFPWMALLEYSTPEGYRTACGGVLIHKRYVLTAAHCLNSRELVKRRCVLQNVILGDNNLIQDPDCERHSDNSTFCADEIVTIPVEEKFIHENFIPNSRDLHNDIALLRLSQDAPFTNFIKPICLPTNGSLGNEFVVAGWGKNEIGFLSTVKLKVTINLFDKDTCDETYDGDMVALDENQICVGGEKNKDSCAGDSGGSLMQLGRNAKGLFRWTAVGIVSLGTRVCGREDWPGIYTKVHSFMPWILSKLRP